MSIDDIVSFDLHLVNYRRNHGSRQQVSQSQSLQPVFFLFLPLFCSFFFLLLLVFDSDVKQFVNSLVWLSLEGRLLFAVPKS